MLLWLRTEINKHHLYVLPIHLPEGIQITSMMSYVVWSTIFWQNQRKKTGVVAEHPNFLWKLPKASFIVCLCFTTLFNFAETSDRKLEFVLTENTLLF